MLSKSDLKQISNLLKPIQDGIAAVNVHNIRIEKKLWSMEEKFEKNLFKWKSEWFDKIDPVIKHLEKTDQENTILKSRYPRKSKLLERVKKIEQHLDLPTPSVT